MITPVALEALRGWWLVSLCPDLCGEVAKEGFEMGVLSTRQNCLKLPVFHLKTSERFGKTTGELQEDDIMYDELYIKTQKCRYQKLRRSLVQLFDRYATPVASPTFCGYGSLGKCCNCLPWSWSSLEHVGLENWMNSMHRRVSRWISVQYVKLGRFDNYSLTWSKMAKMRHPEGGFHLNTSKHFEWS